MRRTTSVDISARLGGFPLFERALAGGCPQAVREVIDWTTEDEAGARCLSRNFIQDFRTAFEPGNEEAALLEHLGKLEAAIGSGKPPEVYDGSPAPTSQMGGAMWYLGRRISDGDYIGLRSLRPYSPVELREDVGVPGVFLNEYRSAVTIEVVPAEKMVAA